MVLRSGDDETICTRRAKKAKRRALDYWMCRKNKKLNAVDRERRSAGRQTVKL